MPVEKSVVDSQLEGLKDYSQWFTKKEINHLPAVLDEGEVIRGFTSGFYDGNTWLIVVTNRRLLFLDKGMIYGMKQMEMPLKHISAISHKTGLMFGEISVQTSGGTHKISKVFKKNVSLIARTISDLIKETHEPAPINNQNNSVDVATQLEKLGSLKEKGLLTDEEFQTQKTKLLSL